jgi:peptide/nickel transport system ATP-binding protein
MAEVLMDVDRLSVEFVSAEGAVCAVDQVSLTIGRGEIVGLAGESGSGKSTLARALLRVLGPPAVITGGHVRMGGVTCSTSTSPRCARSAGPRWPWSISRPWTR